ncbi:hypothetical protein [Pseudaminobacter sp. NGMCC 1.201702]|uniref:hypothetical protein n=1 Tax=Pseudaminobacter sp. NGMCC 1.201702 TaxID=3391825 RepID=UPI0039F14C70
MRPIAAMIAAVSVTALASGTAFAACPETTGSVSNETTATAGIAKDGTHAPLETDAEAKSGMNADTAQKDGKTMPLAEQEAGGNKDLATSQQDVEAQQQGEQTAAAEAEDEACKE